MRERKVEDECRFCLAVVRPKVVCKPLPPDVHPLAAPTSPTTASCYSQSVSRDRLAWVAAILANDRLALPAAPFLPDYPPFARPTPG